MASMAFIANTAWTHCICVECWDSKKNPSTMPVQINPDMHYTTKVCCYCGGEARHGIYARENPDDVIRRLLSTPPKKLKPKRRQC